MLEEALFLILATIAGCNSDERNWEKAARSNSVAEYQAYLRDHPDGKHATEARIRLEELAFAKTTKDGTAEACREFARQHPKSPGISEVFLANC